MIVFNLGSDLGYDIRSFDHDNPIINNSFEVVNNTQFSWNTISGDFTSPTTASIELVLLSGFTIAKAESNFFYMFDRDQTYRFVATYTEE